MTDQPGRGSVTLPPKSSDSDSTLSCEILEALSALPEQRRDEIASIIVSQEFHSGPMPSPKRLLDNFDTCAGV